MRGNPSLCTVIEEEVRNSGPSLFPHSLSHVIKKKKQKKTPQTNHRPVR